MKITYEIELCTVNGRKVLSKTDKTGYTTPKTYANRSLANKSASNHIGFEGLLLGRVWLVAEVQP